MLFYLKVWAKLCLRPISMHIHINGNNLFLKIMKFLSWTICIFLSQRTENVISSNRHFQSTVLLSQDFSARDTVHTRMKKKLTAVWICGSMCVCVCVCVCERTRGREDAPWKTLVNSHGRNNSWKCSYTQ
jgi:hypothetical protein